MGIIPPMPVSTSRRRRERSVVGPSPMKWRRAPAPSAAGARGRIDRSHVRWGMPAAIPGAGGVAVRGLRYVFRAFEDEPEPEEPGTPSGWRARRTRCSREARGEARPRRPLVAGDGS